MNKLYFLFMMSLPFQGKEVIEYYLNELMQEGITEIPRWVTPEQRTLTSDPSSFTSTPSCSALTRPKPSSQLHLDLSSPGNSSRDVTSFRAASSEPSTPDGEFFCCTLFLFWGPKTMIQQKKKG